jgi:hypothetical protein
MKELNNSVKPQISSTVITDRNGIFEGIRNVLLDGKTDKEIFSTEQKATEKQLESYNKRLEKIQKQIAELRKKNLKYRSK